jgi:hypothetical protein
MLIQLTVGKVDAGVAVLLTEDKRLVSIPPSLSCSLTTPLSTPLGSLYITDRIPLHPPPLLHNLRLDRRHHRLAKHAGRAKIPSRIRRPPVPHPQHIWPALPLSTHAAPPRRNPDLAGARVGPHRARDHEAEESVAIPEWQ